MAASHDTLELYEALAAQCERRQDAQQRDVFLVLAADTALARGDAGQAEKLRRRLLEVSPFTLLRSFASFAEALRSPDILDYVVDLRQQYPPQWAAQLLRNAQDKSEPTAGEADIFAEAAGNDPFPVFEPTIAHNEFAQAPPVDFLARPSGVPTIPIPAPTVSQDEASRERKKPVKPRRPSPYDNPDYGPRVPAGPPESQEFVGTWVIYFLVILVVVAGLGLLGLTFVRPFMDP